ncbi:MAG: major capsid protein [Arizlama microvirus]|nr:MAG: major capsid protein [Arizlama microvirus]
MKLFNLVQRPEVKKNAFDLSFERELTLPMGELVPIFLQEVIPGDSFKVRSEILLRFAPLVAPVMHRIDVYTHWFGVTNHQLWDGWEMFITGSKNGKKLEPEEMPVLPHFLITHENYNTGIGSILFGHGEIGDHMGVGMLHGAPVEGQTLKINAMPFLAYAQIWCDYYKDENIDTTDIEDILYAIKTDINGGAIGDLSAQIFLGKLVRKWEKDYFTSALPWVQKGENAEMPISVGFNYNSAGSTTLRSQAGGTVQTSVASITVDGTGAINADGVPVNVDTSSNEIGVSSFSINDLRWQERLQRWLETNARSGSRLSEYILAHFGEYVPDQNHRAEFLGGGRSPVVISEVLQNSETADTPQGNMAGHGISIGSNHGFHKKFVEHGYVLGIMSVMPRGKYESTMNRTFIKTDQFDFALPEFANLGEQPVYNIELYNDISDDLNFEPFGYQSRYSEYKFNHSTVHGAFRARQNGLDSWHVARQFDERPTLNTEFLDCDDDNGLNRIFAVTVGADPIYCQVYHDVKALRPLPFFGTPQL